MKKLIAKIFNLPTDDDVLNARHEANEERRLYYQKVLKELQLNGTLPPDCGLKMPKQTVKIVNAETSEVIAEKGRWLRLPLDGEPAKIIYEKE